MPDLFDYQKEGVDFILKKKRVYLAFDMGMGKTLTALAATISTGHNVLVIAELNEIENSKNFQKEVERYFPDTSYVSLREVDIDDVPNSGMVAGVNPDKLAKIDLKKLHEKFGAVIVDEATLAKTTTTARFRKVKKVCDQAEYLVLLSGTPMMNGASEIYAPLLLIGHKMAGDGTAKSRKAFETIFAGGFLMKIRNTGKFWMDYQWWAKGANNVRELRYLINDHFIFKRKSDTKVFKSKERLIVRVPMTPEWRSEYNKAWNDYIESVGQYNMSVEKSMRKSISNINELRRLIENGQMYQVNSRWKALRVAKDISDGIYGDRRIIVFSVFQETDRLVQEYLSKFGVSFKTFDQIEDWKKGTEQVLVGRIKSHAKGGNAFEASATLFVDMDFVPANNIQAENRMDRPEQTRDMIVRYYMTDGADIIDNHVQKIVKDKVRKIDKFMAPLTNEEMALLPDAILNLKKRWPKECALLSI